MKHIHFPTLLMHIALAILAVLTIHDYPDGFLCVSVPVLLLHAIWAVISRRDFLAAYAIGLGLQFLIVCIGILPTDTGAFGLGGSSFALYLYQSALAISFAVITTAHILRRIRRK